MALDLTSRHPTRIQRNHRRVEPIEAAFVLRDRHRVEAAIAVSRDRYVDLAQLGRHRLRRRPVAMIASLGSASTFVTEMIGQFGLETGLQDTPDEASQHTVRPGQVHTISSCLRYELLSNVTQIGHDLRSRRRHQADVYVVVCVLHGSDSSWRSNPAAPIRSRPNPQNSGQTPGDRTRGCVEGSNLSVRRRPER